MADHMVFTLAYSGNGGFPIGHLEVLSFDEVCRFYAKLVETQEEERRALNGEPSLDVTS